MTPLLAAPDKLLQLVDPEKPVVGLVSFEGLQTHSRKLRCTRGVELVVIDEAHRLRNKGRLHGYVRVLPSAHRGVKNLAVCDMSTKVRVCAITRQYPLA